jgi:hypothetical protein
MQYAPFLMISQRIEHRVRAGLSLGRKAGGAR